MDFIDLLTHSERNFIQASKSDNFLPVANKNKHDKTENQSKSNDLAVGKNCLAAMYHSLAMKQKNSENMSIKFHSKY